MGATRLVETKEAFRAACAEAVRGGGRLALVPTMGYLHAGHEALLREARGRADFVAATIFVNPTQFCPGEDLDRYPRDLQGDLEVCRRTGADLVFAPGKAEEMYPGGFRTRVTVEEVTRHLCGASRPGHFMGVTTIVSKLFNLARPHLAVFGEKDYQQLVTIRTMVRDLDMDVEIVGVPTVRESDGVALSSRNALLGEEARGRARCLVEGLRAGQKAFACGERRAEALIAACRVEIERGADSLDYVHLADPENLELLEGQAKVGPCSRMLLAARLHGASGTVRLIDNAAIGALI